MNAELDTLAQAIRRWRAEHDAVFPTPDGVASLRLLLCEHEATFRTACERVGGLTFQELEEIAKRHQGQGLSAPGPGLLPDYAARVLNRCRGGQFDQADADRVEMLKRVVDYAKLLEP